MAAAPADISAFLTASSVDDLPAGDNMLIIQKDADLTESFNSLIARNVQSAPVQTGPGQYSGFLDLRDLVSFLVLLGDHTDSQNMTIGALVAAGSGNAIDNCTVTYLSRRNGWRPVNSGGSLLDVAKILRRGVKRVPIVDPVDHRVLKLVSQSDLIRIFADNIELIPATLLDDTVANVLSSCIKNVFHVHSEDTMLAAFRLMDKHKITGLALTDANNDICGVITGKDLKRFVGKPSYEHLHLPIGTVLSAIRQEGAVDIAAPTIVVTGSTSFRHVIQKFRATRIHRLYIVESATSHKLVGVITCTDVIKAIVPSD